VISHPTLLAVEKGREHQGVTLGKAVGLRSTGQPRRLSLHEQRGMSSARLLIRPPTSKLDVFNFMEGFWRWHGGARWSAEPVSFASTRLRKMLNRF
jgi:hypothetical protein